MFAPETVEKVLCHLLRFGSSRADAEDLAQEALLIAWRERAQLDTTRSLDGWLYGIARNVFRNHARRERRNPVDATDDPEDAASNAPSIGDVLTLQTALHALPENQQDIVILHELEGHTLKETAELLAIPFDTAKDRLKRARISLEAACGATLDAAVRAEQPATRRVAKAAMASVLAGLLGAIAKEGVAVAAGAAATSGGIGVTASGPVAAGIGVKTGVIGKAILVATLATGIVVGVVVDRIARPTMVESPRDASLVAESSRGASLVPSNDASSSTPDAPAGDDVRDGAADDARTATIDTDDNARTATIDTDDIAAEASLVDRARVALRTNAPRDALRVLGDHQRRFARGQLAEERELLAIEAHVALRERERARARIAQFRASYPRSSHASKIDELLRSIAP